MATKRTIDQPVVSTAAGAAAAPARRPSTISKRPPRAASAETSKEATPVAAAAVTEESIAHLAYAIWESRGCQGGSPEEDWLQAERQLRAAATK